MNVLILGSGAREHAFALKISESSLCKSLYVAPGNGGTESFSTNLPINVLDFEKIASAVIEYQIDIVIVGPEAPLVAGIQNFFKSNELLKDCILIGPSKEGAQLEGSKLWAKHFMQRNNIPTANFKAFNKKNIAEGASFIASTQTPIVLKADGLAAGKGVLITSDKKEAFEVLQNMILEESFGRAGEQVLIEEFLDGIEFSVFALTDGENYKLFANAKDYKRIGENDTGLNTGGMGAIAPVPFVSAEIMQIVEQEIIQPTIKGLKQEKISYKGFIYFGLILIDKAIKVIEYNCRMGDPETEVVLPLLKSDLLRHLVACSKGTLAQENVESYNKIGATVIVAANGYPIKYKKETPIQLANCSNTTIYQGGTKVKGSTLVSNGGRVLAVSAIADTLQDALHKSYTCIQNITYSDKYYRKDIGWEFLQ